LIHRKPTKRKLGEFKATIAVDNPDVKIVEGRLDNKPCLLLVGTSKQRDISIAGEGGVANIAAKYQSQKDLDWQILINPQNLSGFEPLNKRRTTKDD
jgi:hypothetical protein